MASKYELTGLMIEPEYSDEWETTLVAQLRRDDGVTGKIWIVASVPEYLRGTARAAGTSRNLVHVWVFDGGSPDTWCPEIFDFRDSEAMLAVVRDAALAKHAERDYKQLREDVDVQRTDDGFKWRIDATYESYEYSDILGEVDRQAKLLDEDAWQEACDAKEAPDALVSGDGWRYIMVREDEEEDQ